jgi:hypothetical protein
MSKRLSKFSRERKEGRTPFSPDIDRWTEICKMSAYDNQIYRSFQISHDTFYSFIDRERLKQEQDPSYESAYIAAYINKRHEMRQIISDAFMQKIEAQDTASILFGMKTYNGMIEEKDIRHIELKKQEIALKTNAYLTELASKFSLDFDQLKEFSKMYFKGIDLNE